MTPRSAALLRERAELQRQLARVDAALAASLPRGRGMNPAGVAVSDQEPPVIGALIAPVTRRTKPRARPTTSRPTWTGGGRAARGRDAGRLARQLRIEALRALANNRHGRACAGTPAHARMVDMKNWSQRIVDAAKIEMSDRSGEDWSAEDAHIGAYIPDWLPDGTSYWAAEEANAPIDPWVDAVVARLEADSCAPSVPDEGE